MPRIVLMICNGMTNEQEPRCRDMKWYPARFRLESCRTNLVTYLLMTRELHCSSTVHFTKSGPEIKNVAEHEWKRTHVIVSCACLFKQDDRKGSRRVNLVRTAMQWCRARFCRNQQPVLREELP